MKYFRSFFFGLFILSVTSCQMNNCGFSKDQFLTNYDEFMGEIKDKSRSDLKGNWDKYDPKMERFIMDCYDQFEKNFTEEEKAQFWINSIIYYVKRYGLNVLNKFDDDTEDEIFVKIKHHLEELDTDIDIDGEQFFEDITGEDLDKLMEELSEDLQKWGERFKSMFGIEESK